MITQSKIIPLLWLAMLLMLVGCNGRLSLVRDVIHFYTSEVSFPDKMLLIENGDSLTVSIPEIVKPLLIHYYGPDECSDCALNHMRDNVRLAEYSKENGKFDFIVILAPPYEEKTSIIEKAIEMSLPVRIYVDDMHYFYSEGVILPYSSTHIFMINSNHIPVYVGHPFENTKSKVEFEKRVKECLLTSTTYIIND